MKEHLINTRCLRRLICAIEGKEVEVYGCGCLLCGELLQRIFGAIGRPEQITEQRVREIVEEMFGVDNALGIGMMTFTGNVSFKMVGESVGDAGLRNRRVIVDFGKVRSIGGHKVRWP